MRGSRFTSRNQAGALSGIVWRFAGHCPYNGGPIGLQFPPHVELTVTSTEPGVRGDTASGGVTKAATLETGLEIRVPLFIKEGEKVKVHTETREFAGRA